MIVNKAECWINIHGNIHGGIDGDFDRGENESEDDRRGDEEWENDTCKVDLWIIIFDWKRTVWAVVGDKRKNYGCRSRNSG